jgi:hypothetical protein
MTIVVPAICSKPPAAFTDTNSPFFPTIPGFILNVLIDPSSVLSFIGKEKFTVIPIKALWDFH